MALDKEKLMEKMKGLSPEDRSMFRDVLTEIDPPDDKTLLSSDEISTLKDMLSKKKTKKKGILDALDSLFE